LGSPRKKITISAINILFMSFSIINCCFDDSIVGGLPLDIRDLMPDGCGYASQISTQVSKTEITVT
jgi:hypothetical protein